MNTYIFSRILRNGVWFGLAMLCVLSSAWCLYGAPSALSLPEVGILASVALVSMVTVDLLSAADSSGKTPLLQSLAAMCAISTMLFPLSWSHGLFAGNKHLVLAVLCLLIIFRLIAEKSRPGLRYPAFMSTGVLLLGNGPSSDMVKKLIENSRGRYRIIGQIPYSERESASPVNQEELPAIARKAGAGALVVAFPERRGAMPVTEIMRCRMQGIAVMDVPSFYESATRKLHIESITPSWFIFSSGFNISTLRRAFKRATDMFAAGLGLALTLPFLPLVALLIKIDSPGPVFFCQTRTGLGGRNFSIIKLRTMRADAEGKTGACWAGKNDPRVTRVGRFLRKTRLDEIPQLVNVLLGHMSLIGPRPERPEFISELERHIPFYSERHCVKPGITGWAQVCYRYGSSMEDSLEKLRFDLYYIKNQSVLLDLEIVLRTIGVVLLGSGAR